jgi:hypothetical protein
MPLRDRRAAHVRPRQPSFDRVPSRQVRSDGPPPAALRRYGTTRRETRLPLPAVIALAVGGVVLAVVTVVVGLGIVSGVVGGIAGAFGDAMARISSQAPATVGPSGVSLDTPVFDAPDNGGYTNLTPTALLGSVPASAAGKDGYSVIVYRLAADGGRQKVAQVKVGATTHFVTPPIPLTEGENDFVATLATPAGEGQPSPATTIILDTRPPALKVTSPAANALVSVSAVDVTGLTDAGSTVTIRNEQAPGGAASNATAGTDGKFKLRVPVVAGSNTIDLTSTDRAGNATNISFTLRRSYGKLAAHLSASPAKFASSALTQLTLTVHATSINGGPLANAKVTFTVTVYGLGPIVSPELTTDATGTATWTVSISGAQAGLGQASALVTGPAGDQTTGTTAITTT